MIKIFISYFKPYKKLFYLDLFVVSIATICDLIYPIMTRILVKELCKGRTTIVVAHRLSTIKNADEIVVLTDKGIEEIGSHDELINIGGIYFELNKYAMVN